MQEKNCERNPFQKFKIKLNFFSTKNELIAELRHYNNDLIISVSSKEPGIMEQLVSPTDIIAHYAVGRLLGVRMQMAGITNCTFPYL